MGQLCSTWSQLPSKRGPIPPNAASAQFSQLPFEIRSMIWELALPSSRIVEVHRTSSAWISKCHPPPVLQVNSEARALAQKYYTFCHKPTMLIYLNPKLDTLHIGPFDSFESLIAESQTSSILTLQNLAIHESHLSNFTLLPPSHHLSQATTVILINLKRLMIGVSIPSDGYPDLPTVSSPSPPHTPQERSTLYGSDPHMIMSAHSWDGHLFHFGSNDSDYFAAVYPGSRHFKATIKGYENHKIFSYWYPPDPDREGLRGNQWLGRFMQPGNYDNVVGWYRVIYRSVAKADVCVQRILQNMRDLEWEGKEEGWVPPRVASFARPNGSFLDWKQCLEPLVDREWSSYQDLSRFVITGRRRQETDDAAI